MIYFLYFIFIILASEVMKLLNITPILGAETTSADEFYSLRRKTIQSDLVLVLVCALAPQPLNLNHCHLKNILVDHLRDSNSFSKSSYLFLRFCHYTVAA